MSRLYLVDDHAIVREGLRAVLEASGHRVVGESADPVQALADLARDPPDLVLVDLNLGERSGLELLAELQRRALPVRSIVLTMSAQPHHVGEAMRRGALSYVLKGSPTSELLRAIDAGAQGRRHLSAEVANLAAEALTGDDDDGFATLSPRERQIVAMVVRGKSSAAIGQALHLSPKTVDTYRSRLMNKLGVGDVPALVRLAIRHGLIEA
ncbi:MAG: response regulator transcription factor [Burkholderiaceae bacterium]|nr:response regulator transcription factor [Burkholderiaceae bacterium]